MPRLLLTSSITVIVMFLLYTFNVECMKMIPQKASVTFLNAKYVRWANATVRRYGRKSDYYVNLEGYKYHTWNNNITIKVIFNEFLHNEYRRSFIEMQFRLCDLINKDEYVGRTVANSGVTCPILEKEIHIMNMTAPLGNFSYEFPFEKARIDVFATITKTGERVSAMELYSLFKDI